MNKTIGYNVKDGLSKPGADYAKVAQEIVERIMRETNITLTEAVEKIKRQLAEAFETKQPSARDYDDVPYSWDGLFMVQVLNASNDFWCDHTKHYTINSALREYERLIESPLASPYKYRVIDTHTHKIVLP